MDAFEPIRVDPEPERRPVPVQPAVGEPDVARSKADFADAAPAVAQTLIILNAIDQRSDAAVSGAAEVMGDPMAAAAVDPLDDPEAPDGGYPTDGGGGCGLGALALLLTLTASVGSALAAVIR